MYGIFGAAVARRVAVAVVLGAGAAAAQPNSPARGPADFGTLDYTATVVPGLSFTSDGGHTTIPPNSPSHGLYRNFPPGSAAYAKVNVPAGAVIDFVGIHVDNPTASSNAEAGLLTVDANVGQSVQITAVTNAFSGVTTVYNADALGYQTTESAHRELVVKVVSTGTPYLGWVEVWWKRSVSPPPGLASFADVPPDHPFFQYIEAIHSAGITAGCGNGNFCPDQPITRKQEAAFVAKALGLHWPN